MNTVQFKHILPLQLRFNDIDKFGHVNNSVYFSFYDLGKTNYFETVYPSVDWSKEAIMVVHLEIDFLAQIYSTDNIAVQTAVTEIGNKSYKLYQEIIDQDTKRIKCSCKSIMVNFDLENKCSKELDEEWKEAVCRFEGRDLRRKDS